jgi:hypothetical protein
MSEFQAANGDLSSAMASHLIDDLLRKRAEAVSAELRRRLTARTVDSNRQVPRVDDFEEETTAFG